MAQDTLHGANFDLPLPTITLNGNTSILGTTLQTVNNDPVTNFTPTEGFIRTYDYSNPTGPSGFSAIPQVQAPVTVTIGMPAGYVCTYTFGPQHPGPQQDYISCFQYSAPFVLTANTNQAGTNLFVTMYVADENGNPEPNDQSPMVVAKFSIIPE